MSNSFKDRSRVKEKFTMVPNHVIRNPRISESAFRLLCYLKSNSDTWIVYQNQILKDLEWGEDKLSSAIKNLKECRYLIVHKTRNKEGKYDYEYEYDWDEIIEENENSNNFTKGGFSTPGSSTPGKAPPIQIPINQNENTNTKERERGVASAPPFFTKEKVKMPLEKYEDLVKEFGKKTVDDKISRMNEYFLDNPKKSYHDHAKKIRQWIEEDTLQSTKKTLDDSWYSEAKIRSNRVPYITFDEDGVGIFGKEKIKKTDPKFKQKVLYYMNAFEIKTEDL